MARKITLITVQVLLVVYITLTTFYYFVQENILFKPEKLDKEYELTYNFPFEERFIEVDEGIEIHGLLAKVDSSKGLVFFCHGNRGSVDTDPAKYTIFLDQGYDVFYFDYRGYGKSDGKISNQKEWLSDVEIVYQEMLKEYDEDEISIVGYSLGSGIAALLAANHDPKNVVLWTPYFSMVDMKNARYPYLPTFLMKYPLLTYEGVQKIDEPITVFYAENDDILPIERSLALTEYLKEGDEYHILENQPHGGVYRHQTMLSELPEALSK